MNEPDARKIIERVGRDAIGFAFVRHMLTSDEFDRGDYPNARDASAAQNEFEEEVTEDAIACLTGDELGCMDEDELSPENCCLQFVQTFGGSDDSIYFNDDELRRMLLIATKEYERLRNDVKSGDVGKVVAEPADYNGTCGRVVEKLQDEYRRRFREARDQRTS
jgi:hypothetical protein